MLDPKNIKDLSFNIGKTIERVGKDGLKSWFRAEVGMTYSSDGRDVKDQYADMYAEFTKEIRRRLATKEDSAATLSKTACYHSECGEQIDQDQIDRTLEEYGKQICKKHEPIYKDLKEKEQQTIDEGGTYDDHLSSIKKE